MATGDFVSATLPAASGSKQIRGGMIDVVFVGATGGTFQMDAAVSTLQTSITTASTTIVLAGNGSKFPLGRFWVQIIDGGNTESVAVLSVSGNTLTLEGTPANNHSAGVTIQFVVNPGDTGAWSALTDLASAKGVLAITSASTDASGNPTTIMRTSYLTRAMRGTAGNTPDQTTPIWAAAAGNVTIRFVLSDPVYSGDTVTLTLLSGLYTQSGTASAATTAASVTNSSALSYDKPLMRWTQPNKVRENASGVVSLIAHHLYRISAVIITETDQHSHSASITPSAGVRYCANTGLYIQEWYGMVNRSTFTAGDTITRNAKVYCTVGSGVFDTSADGSGVEATGNDDQTFIYDPANSLVKYAVIDPIAGTSGGVVSGTLATAQASPFDTYAHAVGGATKPTNVLLYNAHSTAVLWDANAPSADTGFYHEIGSDPRNVQTQILDAPNNSNAAIFSIAAPRLKLSGITHRYTGNLTYYGGGGVNWCDDVIFDSNGSTITGLGIVDNSALAHFTGCTFDDAVKCGLKRSGSDHFREVLDDCDIPINSTVFLGTMFFAVIGSSGPFAIQNGAVGGDASPTNMFIWYSNIRPTGNGAFNLDGGAVSGTAIVGNVVENINIGSDGMEIGNYESETTVTRIYVENNMLLGQRTNILYNDTADREVFGCSFRNNICWTYYNANDRSPSHWTTGFGNYWASFGVCGSGNMLYIEGTDDPDYGGLKYYATAANGTNGVAGSAAFTFVDDQSIPTGSNTGAGDYHATDTSISIGFVTTYQSQTYDLDGNLISAGNNAGAYGGQSFAPTPGTLSSTGHTSTTASFTWTASTGTGTVTNQLQVSPSGAGTYSNVVGATTSPATATGLSAATAYDFRLLVTDDNGTAYSNVVTVTTSAGGGATGNVPATALLMGFI